LSTPRKLGPNSKKLTKIGTKKVF